MGSALLQAFWFKGAPVPRTYFCFNHGSQRLLREVRLRVVRLLTFSKAKPHPGALLEGWQAPHCSLGPHSVVRNLLWELHIGVSAWVLHSMFLQKVTPKSLTIIKRKYLQQAFSHKRTWSQESCEALFSQVPVLQAHCTSLDVALPTCKMEAPITCFSGDHQPHTHLLQTPRTLCA